ncbi:hypothetical protein FOG50_01376 [Hanseniaspora uvarum]|nr:hypothetical protein FOG50_01376 [Hanseniaspora uvarum]
MLLSPVLMVRKPHPPLLLLKHLYPPLPHIGLVPSPLPPSPPMFTYTTGITVTGTDGVTSEITEVVIQTPVSTLRSTIPWSGRFTTSFTTETVVTTDNSILTIPVIIVETPTYIGWNSTTLPTSSISETSTSVSTSTSKTSISISSSMSATSTLI